MQYFHVGRIDDARQWQTGKKNYSRNCLFLCVLNGKSSILYFYLERLG